MPNSTSSKTGNFPSRLSAIFSNLNGTQFHLFVAACGLLAIIFALISADLYFRSNVIAKFFGVERNVYEDQASLAETLLKWAPDPGLSRMPQVPAGVSANFVIRPNTGALGATTNPLFVHLSADPMVTPDAILSDAAIGYEIDCMALNKRLNQAMSIDGETYWFLWKREAVFISEDGGSTCVKSLDKTLFDAKGNNNLLPNSNEDFAVRLSLMFTPTYTDTGQSTQLAIVALNVQAEIMVGSIANTQGQLYEKIGRFSSTGIYEPFSSEPGSGVAGDNQIIAITESKGGRNLFWLTGNYQGKREDDGSWLIFHQPLPSFDAEWAPGPSVALLPVRATDNLSANGSLEIVPLGPEDNLGMPNSDLSQFYLSYPGVDFDHFRVEIPTVGGVESYGIQSDLEGNAGTVQFDDVGPFNLHRLPGENWIRDALISDDHSQVWLSVTPFEKIGIAHRPLIYFSSDAGKNFTELNEEVSPPLGVYISLGGFLIFTFLSIGVSFRLRQASLIQKDQNYQSQSSISDGPIGFLDKDVTGLRRRATALSRCIRNSETIPPVAFGIAGGWGAGKSSLMRMLSDDLRSRNGRVLWFNAWHHQEGDHILAALLETIRLETIPSVFTGTGLTFRLRLAWMRRRRLLDVLGLAIIITAVIVGSIALGFLDLLDARLLQDDGVGSLLLGLFIGTPTLVAFARILKPFRFAPSLLMNQTKSLFAMSSLNDQLSVRHKFQQQFEEVATVLATTGIPLTIIVDDLDRCAPANVKMIIDSISFLTSAGPCFIVVGYDKARVLQLLNGQLARGEEAESSQQANEIAELYLKKIINVEIRVPELNTTQAGQLVDALTGRLMPTNSEDKVEFKSRNSKRRLIAFFDRLLGILISVGAGIAMIVTPILFAFTLYAHFQAIALSPPTEETAISEINVKESTTISPAGLTKETIGKDSIDFSALPQVIAVEGTQARNAIQYEIVILLFIVIASFILLIGDLLRQSEHKLNRVEDDPSFNNALNIWLPLIRSNDATPRKVKQFINSARLQTEILGETRIEAKDLVSLHAIDLVEPDFISQIAREDEDDAISKQIDGLLKAYKLNIAGSSYPRRTAIKAYFAGI